MAKLNLKPSVSELQNAILPPSVGEIHSPNIALSVRELQKAFLHPSGAEMRRNEHAQINNWHCF